MAARRVRSPDGREWEVRVRRVQLPSWPESDYEPEGGTVETWILGLIVAPLFWFVLPLIRVTAALPLSLIRSLFSARRWVEAESGWPEIRILWETTRGRERDVAAAVADRLAHGYQDLTFADAVLVSMTRPPGFDDVSAS